jgi:hypothetical protein
VRIFGLWTAVGAGGIGARILVSLHADRLAHRQRLNVTAQFFEHVLQLHLAYHRSSHSGRLLKIMLQGGDQLFGLWLGMFRELSPGPACRRPIFPNRNRPLPMVVRRRPASHRHLPPI